MPFFMVKLRSLFAVGLASLSLSGWGMAPARAQELLFVRGDVNQDGFLEISDAFSVILYALEPSFEVPCEKAADLNNDGAVGLSDAVYELELLFRQGPAPPAPYPFCGRDGAPDSLTCLESRCGEVGEGTVIFSEIMASSSESIADEDGDSSDWIELHLLESSPSASVHLGGWYLTTDPFDLTMWRIPDGVTIERGGFLLIFASGKDRTVAGAELHASFQLAAEGEFLALVAPDFTVADAFLPSYPEQLRDVSYGLAQATTTLVGPGATVRYRVPSAGDAGLGTTWTDPAFAAAGWPTGTTGLGFSTITTEGFDVTYVKANVLVNDLSVAELVLADPARQSTVRTESRSVVDYFNSGGRGNYAVDNPLPGVGGVDVEDYVLLVEGTVMIPAAGAWSFGVNSDDGFGLELRSGAQVFSMSFPAPRGPADTIQAFNFPAAGPWQLRLVFYERGGGSGVELFAAQGNHPTFNSSSFRLVGDVAGGGLGLLGFASDIRTDLAGAMRNVNASLWSRISFQVDDPAAFGGLALRMKYEDGFVAYLNGEEVARRNAPAALAWNSPAASNRPLELAPRAEEINLTSHLGRLLSGANVLAIHGLNDAASNGDFLVHPELVGASHVAELQYMATPTPGTFNVAGAVDFVRTVEFSVDRGLFDASFSLALSSATSGAQIRYTLDGSTPTATSGLIYGGPLTINRTTVIRAAGFRAEHLASGVSTRTYIFPADVIRQSPSGQSPGPGWPTGTVNGQILDYGMDPNVVDDPRWSADIVPALRDIPSISLVTDLPNLFDPAIGIYVNAGNDGRAWERRTSVELIHPDGTPGFAVDAGLRIRGAFSRSDDNPKHSLHLFFRKEYGPGKLEYPLFDGEGASEFDRIDLITSQNYSWAFSGDAQNTFLREVFSRDTQRDARQPYTRSRYCHLYIDGHYWGLYLTQERPDSEYSALYLGGDSEDYDVIKNDSSGGRALQATNGTMDAYRRLYDAAVAGFAGDTAYFRVQGLRIDGTPDPAGEKLLDPENLMDYMISTYYTGDPDCPVSAWGHISNNVFATYNRVEPDGFTWYRHDAEHSLGASGGLNEARLLTDPTDRTIGQTWDHFNPAWLHLRLTANLEYLQRFADRVHRHFANGGILSPEANIARWMERAGQIDLAVIGASARWGDSKVEPPRTKADWQAQVDYMTGTYFPQRTQIVLSQMRSVSMFPGAALVSFNRHGGEVAPGFRLHMSQSNGITGTIYYTLDGSDPRLRGGGIASSASVFVDDSQTLSFIPRGSVWRYLDDGTDQGSAWQEPGFDDADWDTGPAQLGYGDGDEATVVLFGPDPNNKHPTTYFRRVFTVADASEVIGLTLGIVRDDGAAVYLNGVEAIPRLNLPAGPIDHLTFASGPGVPVGGADETTFYAFDVDPALLVDGTNTIAVEVHQANGASTDLSFDLELAGLVAGDASPPIVIDETTTVRARVRGTSSWGALTQARFTVGLEGLVINEIMASNSSGLEDPDEPGEHPDWIEIYNGTAGTIDLGGMYLSDDPLKLAHWQIAPGVSIAPGARLLFYADDDGTQGAFHTNYQLAKSGETVLLVDRDGETVIDEIEFGGQTTNVSFGRYPDGGAVWGFHQAATPRSANLPHRP
jgi:hypothetical protein